MVIEIVLTSDPIQPNREVPPALAGRVGAHAEFTGIVRDQEAGSLIAALHYEAYLPMAEIVMRRILEAEAAQAPCLLVRVTHRLGTIPVGETAIWVWAAAAHRAEALTLVRTFMDRLKQDVPIWKRRALTTTSLLPPLP